MTQRLSGITWGNDTYAVVHDRWWNTRNTKTYLINPSDNSQEPRMLSDRNYQDLYNHPGAFQTSKNEQGQYTLLMDGHIAYLFGDGYTPDGQFPFIDELDLKTLEKSRIYQSTETDRLEHMVSFIDSKQGTLITPIESPTEFPNYYIRNIRNELAISLLQHLRTRSKALKGCIRRSLIIKEMME